jgi:hypothetical protein
MARRLFRRDNHPGVHVRIRSLHRRPIEPPMQLARPVAREKSAHTERDRDVSAPSDRGKRLAQGARQTTRVLLAAERVV